MAPVRKRATIRQVAEATGLSTAAVSYALRGLHVSEETRRRVEEVAAELGYEADGLYLGLGIGDYSDTSREYAEKYAARPDVVERGATLHVVDIPSKHGFGVPDAARATKRVPCSACGLSKRHLLNKATLA